MLAPNPVAMLDDGASSLLLRMDEAKHRSELALYATRIRDAAVQRWLKTEEILCILTNYESIGFDVSREPVRRPSHGMLVIFDRRATKNFKDDHVPWVKKNKKNRVREDHVKLQLQKVNVVYGTYAHGEKDPYFHRRCYRLAGPPNEQFIHLVHYRRDVKCKLAADGERRPTLAAISTPSFLMQSLIAATSKGRENADSPRGLAPSGTKKQETLDMAHGNSAQLLDQAFGVPQGRQYPSGVSPLVQSLPSYESTHQFGVGKPLAPYAIAPASLNMDKMDDSLSAMFGDIAQDLSADASESLSQDSSAYLFERELDDADAATRPDSGTTISREDLQDGHEFDMPHVVDFTPTSADVSGGQKFLLCLSLPLQEEIKCMNNNVYVRIGASLCPAEILEPGCVLRCYVPAFRRAPEGAPLTLLTVQAVLDTGEPISKIAEEKFQYFRHVVPHSAPRILDTRIPKKRSMLPPPRFAQNQNCFRDCGMASPVESRETKIRIVERLGSLTSALPSSTDLNIGQQSADDLQEVEVDLTPSASVSPLSKGKENGPNGGIHEDCSFKPLSIAELPSWDDPMAITSHPNLVEAQDSMAKSSEADDEMMKYFCVEATTSAGVKVTEAALPCLTPMCLRGGTGSGSNAPRQALRRTERRATASPAVFDDDTVDITKLGEDELESLLDGMLIRVIDQLVELEDNDTWNGDSTSRGSRSSSNLDLTWLANELNAADESGNSLLHYCCAFKILKLIDPLLRYCTNLNMRNNDGDTPLHIACRGASEALVQKLLQVGARPDIENYCGQLPCDLARDNNCDGSTKVAIANMLYQYGGRGKSSILVQKSSGFSTWLSRGTDAVSHSSDPVVHEAFQSLSLHDKCALQLSLQMKDETSTETSALNDVSSTQKRTSTNAAPDSELQTVISNCGSDCLDKAMLQMSNEERNQLEKEARMIARNVKAWFTQRQYVNLKSAATTLQLAWRAAKRREAAKAARNSASSGQRSSKSETRSSGQGAGPMALSKVENEQIKRETLASLKIQRALLRWRMNNQ